MTNVKEDLHTKPEEMVAGNIQAVLNQSICVLLRRPFAVKGIILPTHMEDTRFMPQIAFVLAKGGGYKIKRFKKKHWMQGTKRWADIYCDIPQTENNPYYTGNVEVRQWHFMKHPFNRENGFWIRNLKDTHPEIIEAIDYDDRGMCPETGEDIYRVFAVCASNFLAVINLEEGDTWRDLYNIKRGNMLSAQ